MGGLIYGCDCPKQQKFAASNASPPKKARVRLLQILFGRCPSVFNE